MMAKLHRDNEEHTAKWSELARDSMAVLATLQQLRTERQTEARVYHASRQENMGLHAKCEILQEELEQSQTSSEQAAEAFTRTYDDLQRTKSYSIAQTHHLNNQVIQEKQLAWRRPKNSDTLGEKRNKPRTRAKTQLRMLRNDSDSSIVQKLTLSKSAGGTTLTPGL